MINGKTTNVFAVKLFVLYRAEIFEITITKKTIVNNIYCIFE